MTPPGPQHPSASNVNKPSSPEGERAAAAATLAAPLSEGLGTKIGPYKLLQLIGEGGFGSVFMAQQEQPVQRTVALKIIKLGMDTRQVVARFEQERQALAMMDHSGIARVLDAGATETGRPFFVMELVKGDPIVAYCDKHKLSIHERLELFTQVCQAVQHAHTKGIIHRDIKPSNILVSMQDGKAWPKVIDFGIAKATTSQLTDKTLYTEHRQLVGTPEYMSPEQAEGSLDIDASTDVYSLGVLLYELLTGSPPFDGKKLRSAANAEIQRIIREVEPPKPSTRLSRETDTIAFIAAQRHTEPRKLHSIIRGDLDWIVMKAMEKSRQRRYETANGLGNDVLRYLRGEAVVAAPPGAMYRVRKFVKRNRAIVSAGAAVAGALLIGVAAFAWQAKVALDQRDLALKAQKSEAEQRKTAEEQREAARIAADTAERAAYQAQILSAAHALEDQRIDTAGALLAATSPRLRGWEYRHLASRLDRTLPSPFPAEWAILGIATSASSDRVAVRRSIGSGPLEWVVLEGDLRTERLVAPDTELQNFRLSPDGTRAVWTPYKVGDQRPAILWNIDTKAVLATLPLPHPLRQGQYVYASWRATSDRLAIALADVFQIYDTSNGALLDHRDVSGYARFTADSRWVLLLGSRRESDFGARELQLLDARTLEPKGDVFHLETPTSSVAFWQSRAVFAVEDGTLLLLDIVDGTLQERARLPAGLNNFNVPAWSPDGSLIALGSVVGGRIRVWDSDSGASRGDFGGPQSGVAAQWILPDSGDLWTCSNDGDHRVWPINSGSPGVLTAHKSFVYPAVVSKDGSLLLTGGWDGFVGHGGGLKCWDARTGALVSEYGQPDEIFKSAALTPDGRFAVASIVTEVESSRRTEVIDLTTGSVVTTFRPQATAAHGVCTSVFPDGKRVLSTNAFGEAYVWDLLTGKVLWETRVQADTQIVSVGAAVSSDGRLIALADNQLGIRLVNADTYADIRRWDAHTEGMWSLSFSPDGKWLLSASDDQTIGVWDVATGTLVARLVGHGAPVHCAAVSPDGTRIASGGRDGIVRLWDTTHFQSVAQLGGHTDYVFCLAWSPDGQQLYSTSGDTTVRIWDTRPLKDQIQAQQERQAILLQVEPMVQRLFDELSDASKVAERLTTDASLATRAREVALQVELRMANERRAATADSARAAD